MMVASAWGSALAEDRGATAFAGPSLQARGRLGPLALHTWHACPHRPLDLDALDCPFGLVFGNDTVVLDQAGRSVTLAGGDWTVLRTDIRAVARGSATLRVVGLPGSVFYERGLSPSAAWMRCFSGRAPINRVVASLFASVFDEGGNLSAGEGEETAEGLLRIMKTALAAAARPPTGREALLGRVREFIEWRIKDPDLSPEVVAQALHCTARNIHRAFEGEAETLSQYILRRRLERCRAALQAPTLADRSVTEIAFSWGFNNAAHFSRVFKTQFGVSPSAIRRGPTGPELLSPSELPVRRQRVARTAQPATAGDALIFGPELT